MTGTLTWKQLRDLKTSEFTEAGDKWHEVSDRADSDRVRVDRAMSAKLRETQQSESAEAALGRLQRLSRNFQYLHSECGLVRTALNGLASDLVEPQNQLKQALADAAALNFTVHDDGSVSYPAAEVEDLTGAKKEAPGSKVQGSSRLPLEPPGLGQPGQSSLYPGYSGFKPLNPNAAKAQDVADRVARAVRSAGEIDARYAKTLTGLKAEKGLDVTAATLKDVARDTSDVRSTAGMYLGENVPEDKSPAERKKWWDGLTDEQRQEYLEIAPDLVGSLDGIPAVARDEANRNYLPVLIDDLGRRGGDDAETKLNALRMIQEKLGEPSRPPMFLLGIGDEGNGRAIVSYGNPDTSRNVSAYVPGLSTRLNDEFVTDTMKRAQDTAKGAQRVDPSSASIIWLGYDAPQNVDVMSRGDAQRGAPAYNQFMAGLSATNQNADPHVTAIGHSYGSLTVGTAAKQSGGIPGVDDVILLGSPGVDAQKATDLGVGKEHVFVGAADNDPVTHLPSKDEAALGWLTGGPLGVAVGRDLFDIDNDDVYFGKDPASKAFGAQRFLVDDGPRMVMDGGGFDAHSQYFTPEKDQVSADNIANIVAGHPENIVREKHR
ncbi:alpha/beta hydrolase family protein [Streptomyces yangpuensis]|uniref:Alpha/beta hydrolase family protein n=1 Tax=Streptomyces yangpuensis TaxID=1648182 RepID=A0ABY5Q4Z1_9ACTN|nr:alpha/beta hydrolase family protein [Streptomyces yangpuensis]MBZ9599697.1 alpha/beta hydrolase family protein [Streptomyces erythrochromogenes]UUY51265.1 alpha/beta hydrolase family protein [Streptomyces yangpuensis]